MSTAQQRLVVRATFRATVAAIACLASLAAPARAEQATTPPGAAVASVDTVIVFAAASLKTALDAIGARWTAATGNKVTISYAASGALARQLENGAPADVFASADETWMDYAASKSLIQPASRRALLGNRLVLIAPADAPSSSLAIAKGFDLAAALGDGKLAMGVPGTVPAGTYAKAALTSLGVWDAVAPKVAGAESVRLALAYVARGEARLGIVYETDAMSEPKVKIIGAFPADSHRPIVYPVALTAGARPAAAAFLAYLASPEAAAIFTHDGFTVLP